MAARVSPTETIRAEIHELFASDGELLSVLEQVARLSVRLTFQSVVEEIVCEELGRDRYQRRREDSPEGYRNGWHQPRTLKTAAGPVPLQRPKLRHAHAALCDQLFGAGRQPHQRAGDAGDLLLGAGPVGPRCGGDAGRGLRPGRHDQPHDRQPDLPAAAGRVRRLAPPRPVHGQDRLPVPGRRRSSRCTPRPGPSRCWPPGASTPTDTRCSSALGRGRPSRPTPGEGSWRT